MPNFLKIGHTVADTKAYQFFTFRPPALLEAQARRAYVSLLFFNIYLFIYCLVRPIISTSTGPIFTEFAGLVELWLWVNDLKFPFRSLKGRCHGNQFCASFVDSTLKICLGSTASLQPRSKV